MYKCYHCGKDAVIWDCDYNADAAGRDGDGVISEYHCTACGTEITLDIPAEIAREAVAGKCSICGEVFDSYYWANTYFKYCYNCGAKMNIERK